MSVEDRIAFACLFLSDMQIYAYVEELMDQAITEGDLQGILLTGLTKDGVQLLQSYVDMVSWLENICQDVCNENISPIKLCS